MVSPAPPPPVEEINHQKRRDRKSTRLTSSHVRKSSMPSSAWKKKEYKQVIDAAFAQRSGSEPPEIDTIFENISLLDTFIEPKIVAFFNETGNIPVI